MIKLIYCINRKPGMSVEEFRAYWKGKHAEIAKAIPNVRRYVQNHTLESSYATGQPPYDGAAELWFDDMESFLEALGSPAIQAARDDEANFIDASRTALFLAEENVVVG